MSKSLEGHQLLVFGEDEGVAFDERLLKVVAHEGLCGPVARLLEGSGFFKVSQGELDIMRGATVCHEDVGAETCADALDDLTVFGDLLVDSGRAGVAGFGLGLGVEIRGAGGVDDGRVGVVGGAALRELEEVVSAFVAREMGLFDRVDAAELG